MPTSPALQLGAQKIMVVGVSANKTTRPSRVEKNVEIAHPSLTQIIGHILNSAFVDTLESDLDNLLQINELLSHVPNKITRREDFKPKMIELLEISPSVDLNKVASEHFDDLPGALKLFIKDTGSSAMLSLLLFESEYCNKLMELGFMDAVAKENDIRQFFEIT